MMHIKKIFNLAKKKRESKAYEIKIIFAYFAAIF
jgi:hypothetical protein